SINTITFRSQSGDSSLVLLQGASTYVLYLNGADYIRIRAITLQNTGSGRVIDLANNAQFNRIENCRIIGYNTTVNSSSYFLIYKASTGTNESGTEIRNNVLQYGAAGIYLAGFSSTPYESGTIIENNRITDQAGYGIYVGYQNASIIRNNFIDLTANASSGQYGIYTQYIYNNSRVTGNDVRVKNYAGYFYYTYGSVSQRALISNNFFTVINPTGSTLYGIYDYYGQYLDYFHNTVTTTNASSAFTNYTLYDNYGSYKTYYNNIFRNNGAAGSTNYVAYVFTGTGNVYDYNDYWWPTGSTNIAYWSSYGNFTTSQWFTFRSGGYGGGSSINVDPQFVSTTNLRHYNSSLNAGINLLGQVGTDIDGATRTVPVTIGAAEFKPVPNDAGVSAILNMPPCAGSSNVQVRISSYGTNTLTSASINWTVNGVLQSPFSWTGSIPQNGVSSPITLGTYTYAPATNYTVTAWTSSPNGSTDGNTTNDQSTVNTATAMGGTYTIGSTGNYTTFAAAITDLQTYGVCAPTLFQVANGTYTETLIIPQITGSNSINTITFESQSGDSSQVLLQGASTYVLYLNGADYVRIRKMTLQNTGSGRVIDFANSAQYNRIENCRILGFNTNVNSSTYYLIYKASSSTSEAGTEIRNNVLQYGAAGVYWTGYSSSPYEPGLIIENNRITDQAYVGVYVTYTDAAIIRNNFIDLTANSSTNQYGIYTQYIYNSSRILANDVRVKNYPGYFYYTYGFTGQRALIANNFFNANNPSGATLYGIYDYYGQYLDYYHNTVTTTNPSAGFTSYTLYDNYGSFKNYTNNIFRNNGAGGANNYVAYVYTGTGNTFDYNDYWWIPGSSWIAYWSSYGQFSTSIWTTFRNSAYGGANSVNIDPQFISSTNLHHANNSLNAGTNLISTVNRDIDGVLRTTPVTIGADEYKPMANDASVTAILNTPPCAGVGNIQVSLASYGTTTLTSATLNWSINGITQTPYNWTGSINQGGTLSPVTVGTFNYVSGNNYALSVWTSNPNGGLDGNLTNDMSSINTAPALGGTYTIGSGGNYATFTAAVTALQTYGVCAPTTFLVSNGIYVESITLPQITGANSINTVTFQSLTGDSTGVTLQSPNSYVVYLNGADYVRFRKMTIQNSGSGQVVFFANNAQFNRIENCRIIGFNTTTNSTSYALIVKTSSATNEMGTEIRNNVMQYGQSGVYWAGFSSAPYESGMIIENNQMTEQNTYGLYLSYMDGAVIRKNNIDLTGNASSSQYGIYTQYMYNSTRILANDVRAKNYAGYFYYTYGYSGTRALIANNFFTVINPTGSTLYGIYDYYGQYLDYFHNSVTTTNASALNTSYTLYDNYGSFKNYYNNIFRNNGVAGANNYVVYLFTGTGNQFDYNDYFWPSGSTNIAYWSSFGNFNTGQWTTFRNSSYGGSNSININPQFISSTNLRTFNNSLNAGMNLLSTINTDLDGATRVTPVTIGADEYKPVPNDASVSSIVGLPPCSGVSNVQVSLSSFGTTALTSATINWSVNGVAQTPFSWTGSVTQGNTVTPVSIGTYSFVQGTAYTITASSTIPNGGVDGNPANDQASINTVAALGGTYTIGSGGTYPTFTSAINALQTFGVCAPTTFQVVNGTYAETLILPQINGANSINTITFQSQSGDSSQVLLQGASTYVVYLNGGDYFRFRKMTIQNTGSGRVFDFANSAQFNRIENCRILGFNTTVNSSSYYLIYKASSASNESGTEIRNNYLQYGAAGIYWAGFSSAPYESGVVIENNRIVDQSAYGVYLNYQNAPIIRNNYIDLMSNGSTTQYGIACQYLYNNTRILANDVRVKTYGGYLFYLYGTSTQRALVANNFFNVIHPSGTTIYGLYNQDGTYVDFFHNTVNTTNPSASFTSYTLYDQAGSFKNFQNNIFRNNSAGGATNYVAYVTTGAGNVFDYNDYWWSNGSNYIAYWSSYGNFFTSQWSTFRGGAYGGTNSVNIDPQFISSTNLRHNNTSLNAGLNLLTAVNTDIDGQTRTLPVTMGADEYKSLPNDAGVSTIVSQPPCSGPSKSPLRKQCFYLERSDGGSSQRRRHCSRRLASCCPRSRCDDPPSLRSK
ncbi:MAG: hypothetical protein EBX50_12950, partial [Chitinophagia bacterium]|nr:hypothetical protein [Chitinophagia bacterium]